MKTAAIVVCAGIGKRLNLKNNAKPFLPICGKPILARTLMALEKSSHIDGIIVVANKRFIKKASELIMKFGLKKISAIACGGKNRSESVYNGLNIIGKDIDIVLIHDGARPFLSGALIKDCVKAAEKFGAAVAAVPVESTVKEADKKLFVKKTLDRNIIWAIQTPQVFKREIIMTAYKKAVKNKESFAKFTDDAMLVERLGKKVKIVMGDFENIKITRPADLKIAESFLK